MPGSGPDLHSISVIPSRDDASQNRLRLSKSVLKSPVPHDKQERAAFERKAFPAIGQKSIDRGGLVRYASEEDGVVIGYSPQTTGSGPHIPDRARDRRQRSLRPGPEDPVACPVYDNIMATMGIPFMPNIFEALAQQPEMLKAKWEAFKSIMGWGG